MGESRILWGGLFPRGSQCELQNSFPSSSGNLGNIGLDKFMAVGQWSWHHSHLIVLDSVSEFVPHGDVLLFVLQLTR